MAILRQRCHGDGVRVSHSTCFQPSQVIRILQSPTTHSDSVTTQVGPFPQGTPRTRIALYSHVATNDTVSSAQLPLQASMVTTAAALIVWGVQLPVNPLQVFNAILYRIKLSCAEHIFTCKQAVRNLTHIQ